MTAESRKGGGGTTCEDDRTDYSKVAWGQGGTGGYGAAGNGGSGSSGGSQWGYASYGSHKGGDGGSGGASAYRGSDGTLEAMSTATLTISPSRSASQPTPLQGSGNVVVSYTITFWGDNSSVGTRTASLAFAPPDAPAVTKDGYVFLGYYTQSSGGTQIYDENRNCVYSVWPLIGDMMLYAQWLRLSNITFISEGNTVGTAVAQKGKALPAAP